MGSILAQIGFPTAVGAYNDGQAVHVSRVVSTPFGPIEFDRFSETIEDGDEASGLARSLDRIHSRGSRLRMAFGVPTERCYFATRPVSAPGGSASAKTLLRESLRCGSVPVDKMTADVLTSRPDRREVASIAACDRAYMKPLQEGLDDRRFRLVRAEPVPCVLLRLAHLQDRQRRDNKVVVRVFLGDNQALAVLAMGHQPIVWRAAPLPKADEAAAIVALVRSLASVAKPCGVERQPDAVVLHGRMNLERLIDKDWVVQQVGIPLRWLEGPALDSDQIAFGLALGALSEEAEGFDLAREHRQQPALRDIVPWREALLYVAMLFVLAGFLRYRKLQVEADYSKALTVNRQSADASVPTNDLEREKRDLEARISAVRRFLDSRATWTTYLRDLSAELPDAIYLTSFSGDAELQGAKKGKAAPKRSLVIKGALSLPDSGLIPYEVDQLFNTIREHPLITEDFPVVELADLKQFRRVGEDGESAMFTVMCLPKGSKKKK